MALQTLTASNEQALSRNPIIAADGSGGRADAVTLVDADCLPAVSVGTEPAQFIKTYLLNGASSDMAVDGSSTPVDFSYTVAAGKRFFANRVMIYMEAATAFSSEKFANLTALTNGVVISAAGETIETWKDNIDLVTCMFDTEGRAVFAKATESIGGRWTFGKETGSPIRLEATEAFKFTINDNLSTLVHFRAKIGGKLVDA